MSGSLHKKIALSVVTSQALEKLEAKKKKIIKKIKKIKEAKK